VHRLDVDEVMDSLSVKKLREWQHYECLEPFGARRDDYRIGVLISLIGSLLGLEVTPAEIFPELAPGKQCRPRRPRRPRSRRRLKIAQSLLLGFVQMTDGHG